MGKVVEGTVREFSAMVNGKRRSVLITMPPGKENDVEEAWLIVIESEHYWDVFWGNESNVNDPAEDDDWTVRIVDMKLRKVRLS